MKSQAGFTLLEVMIAIMLMAIVSMISWRGLDSVSRAQSHLEESTEHTAQLLRAVNQLKRDLDMRATTELWDPVENQAAPSNKRLALPAAVQVKGGKPGALQLEIIRNPANQPGSLQRVRWWVASNTLYRATASLSNQYPLPAPRNAVAVLEQVTDFNIRTWQPGKGWRDVTSAGQDNPVGLEIRLSRRGVQGVEHYRVVVGVDGER
ncbi:prepilin-type N-terminal cleavage/methylation domain-containing protein [Pseudomonas aestusnigri]|uniref:type II secretion system protein GspJ n=1 Tax=Halopseudomonas aestusnigri TaxID=857252 RepID=UPI001D18CB3F|nr:type II secretion system protein GspJ [Halopseudomonas aestusnigri]MCC4261611.1 prepilin-type N-terminal cleavage/methylation domain-containing protein [Halopseudomonas aestusnigri]